MTEPLLTLHDRQSALWLKLKPWLEKRLAVARTKNDGDLPADKTARVRGQIAELKALLSLDSDKPQVENDEHRFKD